MASLDPAVIRTLPPGASLDALWAEQKMSCCREVRVKASTEFVRVYTEHPGIGDGMWTKEELQCYGAAPPVSTDDGAAMSVVHEMRRRGYGLHCHCEGNMPWKVDFSRLNVNQGHISESFAEAVVKAALLALAAAQALDAARPTA